MKTLKQTPRPRAIFAMQLVATVAFSAAGHAQSNEQELAKQLSNPVASLISVPFQFNFDNNIGTVDRGSRFSLNFQPVIPIKLNSEWNLISRTILPLIAQSDLFPGAGSQFGLGDTVQSFFLSPSAPTSAGIIWGVGPVFLIPSGTDRLLSGRQWGGGLTGVALKQADGWTVGALANHIWSIAKVESGAREISTTYLQPFVSYTTRDLWTFGLNTESTYDWMNNKLTIPINATVGKLVKFGSQPVSITLGLRYYAISPSSGPKGFGGRLAFTFLFPAR
jgi:hypothetical protein